MTQVQIRNLTWLAFLVGGFSVVHAGEPECVPAPELCNDVDDDCDGAVDEDFNLDEPCFDGVGACQRPGQYKCFEGRRACKTPPLGEPSPEVCNDRDDDCDNTVDEDTDCGGCVPTSETCNGEDDDCDVNIDEGFNVGGACVVGIGECAVEGSFECSPDGAASCVPANDPREPSVELCNGLDDDCDGRVDEGYDVGDDCIAGDGLCRETGKIVCTDDGGQMCDAEPGIPGQEVCNDRDDDCDGEIDEIPLCSCSADLETCNGIDDDCDGVTDEGLDQGEPCSAGTGECLEPGEVVCRDGESVCTAAPGSPDAETCNGLDDDCDTKVDEDFPVGDGCTAGEGVCAAQGEYECLAGGAVCNAVPGEPSVELCDGEDNDCDGLIDEGFGLGDACNVGVGACANEGEIVCVAGQATCNAIPLQPRMEQCNSLDDDCDALVDEGTLNACGECGAAPNETCNDRDDDCDGTIDEGACVVPCALDLAGVCADNCPLGLVCDQECLGCVPPPIPDCQADGDRCEDRCPEYQMCDQDCGECVDIPCRIDDGTGICRDECTDGLVCDDACGSCVQPCQAAGDLCVETCPDGQVCDQDCGSCIEPCVGNIELCEDNCPQGNTCDQNCGACVPDVECALDNGICADNCPQGQVCDADCGACMDAPSCGRDPLGLCEDNCPLGSACDEDCGACVAHCDDSSGQCADNCPEGLVCDGQCGGCVPACAQRNDLCIDACPAGLACNNECDRCIEDDGCNSPMPETCDGADNDCDGLIDEGFPIGEDCDFGLGACQGPGITACGVDGELICASGGPMAGDPQPERCDNIDNDCDGAVDEGIGEACSVGEGACQGAGRLECQVDGSLSCSAQPGDPQPEMCNTQDDDCDGLIDETYNVGQACAAAGACDGNGQIVCDGDGGATCDTLVGDNGPEQCDGSDNDCDGAVDERPECCTPGDVLDCGEPVGVCRAGRRTCGGDFVWGVCDGTVDQQAEVCDAQDNDCDGATDENFTGLGEPCIDGEGMCALAGEIICGEDGAGSVCSASLGRPAEMCDGLDTDCDGVIDEGVQNACGNCEIDCLGDAIDNDCDGRVDERAVGENPVRCGGIGDPGSERAAVPNQAFNKTSGSGSGGCAATGDAPTAPLWLLLFGLPLAIRRRS